MKDYRAATWAVMATVITVLTAIGVIPATAAILGLAAGCSGLAFLHALLNPRMETIEIQVGAVNIVPDDSQLKSYKEQLFRAVYGGGDGDRSPDDAGGDCPVHGSACPNR